MSHPLIHPQDGLPGAVGGALAAVQGIFPVEIDLGLAVQYGFNIAAGYLVTVGLRIAHKAATDAWKRWRAAR